MSFQIVQVWQDSHHLIWPVEELLTNCWRTLAVFEIDETKPYHSHVYFGSTFKMYWPTCSLVFSSQALFLPWNLPVSFIHKHSFWWMGMLKLLPFLFFSFGLFVLCWCIRCFIHLTCWSYFFSFFFFFLFMEVKITQKYYLWTFCMETIKKLSDYPIKSSEWQIYFTIYFFIILKVFWEFLKIKIISCLHITDYITVW